MSQGSATLFAVLTRRRFLALFAGGAGVVAACGGLAALRGTAPRVDGLRALTPHEYRTLGCIARAHLPRGGAFVHGAQDFDLTGAFDAFLDTEHPRTRTDLKRALLLVELGPALFDGRPTTLPQLTPEEQMVHWEAWVTSDRLIRRQVALAFRKFLSLVFFDQPEIWPQVGYPGPPLGRP